MIKTKNILTLILLWCLNICVHADTLTIHSHINQVTIYKQGALVERTARVKIPAGITEVKIPMISPNLNQKSIQVGITNTDITLGKVNVDIEIPNRDSIAKINDKLVSRLSVLNDSLKLIKSFNGTLNTEKGFVISNNNIGGSKGFNAEQLSGIASFLRKDLNEIADMQLKNHRILSNYEEEKSTINQELTLLDNRSSNPQAALYISLVSPAPAESEISIKYIIKEAEWKPFYELRVSEKTSTLNVNKKVFVSQKSKEDWNNIKMIVTKSNPSVNSKKPELKRYTLPYQNQYQDNEETTENNMVKVMGVVRDLNGALEGTYISAGNISTETDASGFYQLLVPAFSTIRYSHSGHKGAHRKVTDNNVNLFNINLEDDASTIYAQSKNGSIYLTGTIVDSNNDPVPGVDVVIKGTTKGVVSDFDGNFSIFADNGDVLEFSNMGFKNKTITVSTNTKTNLGKIMLSEDIQFLSDIEVETGYGVARTKNRVSVDQALAGRSSGVQANASSGQPGARSKVYIRGTSSLTGNTQPLYVVDGMPIGGGTNDNPLESIDPNDIISMEVINDASSTSIYGSRAANGVILVTTKRNSKTGSSLYQSVFANLQDYTGTAAGLNSIPSDGVEHEATLVQEDIPVRYSYFAVPKITPNVYMLAEIPDWKKYDLLAGKLRIFSDNTYVGESSWTPLAIEDTLHFSLGVEKNVGIERKLQVTKQKKNLINTKNKIKREWMIVVKNNKEVSIDITLEDQIPVASNDEIKVELIDNGGAKLDETSGKLSWDLKLAPGERKEIKFSYEVTVKNSDDYNDLLTDENL